MLFDVNQLEIRTMYYDIWNKYKESKPLEPLELLGTLETWAAFDLLESWELLVL